MFFKKKALPKEKSKFSCLTHNQKKDLFKNIEPFELRELIDPLEINEEDADYYLPLHYVIRYSQNDALLRQLIYLGADLFTQVEWADRMSPILYAMSFTKNHETIFEMISTQKNIKDPQTWLFSDGDTTLAHEATIRHDAIIFLKLFKDIGLIFERKKPLAQSIAWSDLDSSLSYIEPKSTLENYGSLVGTAIAQGNIESIKYLYSLGYSMYDIKDQRQTIKRLIYSYNHVALNLGEDGGTKYIKLKKEKLKFISEAHPNLFFNSPTEFLFSDNDDLANLFRKKSFGDFLAKRYFLNKSEKPKDCV